MTTDNDAKKFISENIKRFLDEREMSQTALADKIDAPLSTVNPIVRGLVMPGAGIFGRIADALGVTTDDLLARPSHKRHTRQAS